MTNDVGFFSLKFFSTRKYSTVENFQSVSSNLKKLYAIYGGWGNLPWGGDVGGRQAIRSYIPLEKSRCRWLDLSLTSYQAFTQFAVSGISLMYSLASERDTR